MLTIEHPLTGEKLQIANKDFANQMTWSEAMRACENLGSGWRLPTIDELEEMRNQLHKKGEGNFIGEFTTYYWSSNEVEQNRNHAWTFSFFQLLEPDWGYKEAEYYVRAVRV